MFDDVPRSLPIVKLFVSTDRDGYISFKSFCLFNDAVSTLLVMWRQMVG